jgi:hypothetical protein
MHENHFFPKKSVIYNCLVETVCWRRSSVNSQFKLLCSRVRTGYSEWLTWGKWHFEEQFLWCNNSLCMWVIFQNHKKRTISAGKRHIWDRDFAVDEILTWWITAHSTNSFICLWWIKSQGGHVEMCKIWSHHCSVDEDLSLMGNDIILISKYLRLFFEEHTASILDCSRIPA